MSSVTLCEWVLVVWFISHIVEELMQVTAPELQGFSGFRYVLAITAISVGKCRGFPRR